MTEVTSRLAFPMLVAGQAQKEIWHNEALMLADALVQSVVVAVGITTPPPLPAPGQCWIVGAAPTGLWLGKPNNLACWTDGGWRFAAPFEGMSCWSIADSLPVHFSSGTWQKGILAAISLTIGGQQVVGSRKPAIANPGGGTTIDAESRLAVTAILGALRGHGLIATA